MILGRVPLDPVRTPRGLIPYQPHNSPYCFYGDKPVIPDYYVEELLDL